MGNFLSGRKADISGAWETGGALARPVDLAAELAPYWDRVVERLPAGVATDADALLILQLCQALYIQERAWSSIVQDGIATEDRAHGGEPRRNPAVITWGQMYDKAVGALNALGLSPVGRARLQADGEQMQQTDFLNYLQRRHGQD